MEKKKQKHRWKILRIEDRELWKRAKSAAALAGIPLWAWLENAIHDALGGVNADT